MPRTAPGIRPDLSARLTRLEAADPEWRPLVAILRATHALSVEPSSLLEVTGAESEPFLHRKTLRVRPGWTAHALHELASAAAASDDRTLPALRLEDGTRWPALLAASLTDDRPAIEAFAAELAAPPDVIATLAGYAVTALLHRLPLTAHRSPPSSHRPPLTADRSPLTASHCSICAAWPLLAEIRGIEQAVRLRCGRCGGDWAGEWLRCTYCGERDHARLGSLVPEAGPGAATAQHCATCRRYLKVIPVLVPSDPFELLLRDLETVDLDLSARERGFSGPAELGFPLEVNVVEAA
jgi:FdhE protein